MPKLQNNPQALTIGFGMSDTSLGEELRKRRGTRSLRELARETGIDPSQLSRIENDRTGPPTREVMERISAAYGLPLEFLGSLAYAGRKPAPDGGTSEEDDESCPEALPQEPSKLTARGR